MNETVTECLKILVADDNQTDRMILSSIVKKQGHEVETAEDGIEAVDRFESFQPDIILMDAMMPRMTGQEAARKIKELAGNEVVPIIFLTSLQDAESLADCLDSGGDDFLSKPYNRIILKAKIAAFSRMRKMHAEVQHQRDEIRERNDHMLLEQQVAKAVYDNVAHSGCLELNNIKYLLSPLAVFNGDVLLAARKPSGDMHVLLGDFTGHGLPAAIGAMPLAEIFYGMTSKGFNLQEILREVNLKLKTILPVGYFCCTCMACLNFRSSEMEVWMGGLPDFFLYREQTATVERVKSTHLPLGVLNTHAFDSSTHTFAMEPGDKFYMWSDGILEARNQNNDLFGDERLENVFRDNKQPEAIFGEILAAVNEFIGDADRDDDTTLLELTMVDAEDLGNADIERAAGSITGPAEWQVDITLKDDQLRDYNPLPLLMHVVSEVPTLRGQSGQLYTLVAELFSNAFEHGVLGLNSKLKSSPEGFAEYYTERTKRSENVKGFIRIECRHEPDDAGGGDLIIRLQDSGPGFDYQSVLSKLDMKDKDAYSGRGIPLIATLCDKLEYQDKGNIVRAQYHWQPDAPPKKAV
jgi:CheY-like chemotaxis protein